MVYHAFAPPKMAPCSSAFNIFPDLNKIHLQDTLGVPKLDPDPRVEPSTE